MLKVSNFSKTTSTQLN